ncbi:MAG TPA: hypothetical protein PKN36_05890 [bacterium]|nr:hypothetical protein [bacterium]
MKKIAMAGLFFLLASGIVFASGGQNQGTTGTGTTNTGSTSQGTAEQPRSGR